MSWPWLAFIWDSPVNIYIHYIYILIYIYTDMPYVSACICAPRKKRQRYMHAGTYLLYCNFHTYDNPSWQYRTINNICALITYTLQSCEVVCESDFQYRVFTIYFFFLSLLSPSLFLLSFFLCLSRAFFRISSHMSFKSGCILHKLTSISARMIACDKNNEQEQTQ